MDAQNSKAFLWICWAVLLTRHANPQEASKRMFSKQTHVAVQDAPPASHAKPVNLKVLSQDLSDDAVRTLMFSYTQALGVPCGYCHEENPQTRTLDYPSDANPMKQRARIMLQMTSDINTKYLAQLGDRRYAEPLACGNCHQGHASPPTFEPKQ